MKNCNRKQLTTLGKIALGTLFSTLLFTSCQDEADNATNPDTIGGSVIDAPNTEGKIIPGQFIVIFKDSEIEPASKTLAAKSFPNRGAKAKATRNASEIAMKKMNNVMAKNEIKDSNVLQVYTTKFSGMALKLNETEFQKLSSDPTVAALEYDREVVLPEFEIEDIETEGVGQKMAQQTPCGITNAGGAADGSGKDQWIWVIDSGIDLDHPDLNVVTNSDYARTFVGGSPDDCNGHGTHVAGTAAAINNNIGVIGVSAGATVVPVRVFGCNGSSATSTILAGINHVGANDIAGDVVNLSLGGFGGSNCSTTSAYIRSLTNMGNSGTLISIAAGNSSANAASYDPACINGTNIFTVASMTCNGGFSSFSNFNMNPIDVIATGSSVRSTYLNGGYATLSGTSMAAPHVAGIMHARGGAPRASGSVTNRGESYPIGVR